MLILKCGHWLLFRNLCRRGYKFKHPKGDFIGAHMLLYEKKPLSARFPLISIYLAIIGRKLVICLKVVTII
jgi:hypothetical protein